MRPSQHNTRHDEGIPSYLVRLTQTPLLSAEEEIALTRAARNGDIRARRKLIEANMRLVITIAKSYRCRNFPIEDLIQEGAIGLMQAAERFDPDKGFRFSTYSTHWIRQAIGRAIDAKAKAIRLPAHVSQSLRRIERERIRLSREIGAEPTLEQLATAMGVAPRKLALLIQSSQEMLSLDMSVGETEGVTLGALISDEGIEGPEAKMLQREREDQLQRILSELNDREQTIMRFRYHLEVESGNCDDQKDMRLSRERQRQIEVQAIKKLRALALRHRLKEILG